MGSSLSPSNAASRSAHSHSCKSGRKAKSVSAYCSVPAAVSNPAIANTNTFPTSSSELSCSFFAAPSEVATSAPRRFFFVSDGPCARSRESSSKMYSLVSTYAAAVVRQTAGPHCCIHRGTINIMMTWLRSQSRASPNGRTCPAGAIAPNRASSSVCGDFAEEPGANGKSTPKPAEERTLRAIARMSWITGRAGDLGTFHAASRDVACESAVFHTAELTVSEKGGEVILMCWRHLEPSVWKKASAAG